MFSLSNFASEPPPLGPLSHHGTSLWAIYGAGGYADRVTTLTADPTLKGFVDFMHCEAHGCAPHAASLQPFSGAPARYAGFLMNPTTSRPELNRVLESILKWCAGRYPYVSNPARETAMCIARATHFIATIDEAVNDKLRTVNETIAEVGNLISLKNQATGALQTATLPSDEDLFLAICQR